MNVTFARRLAAVAGSCALVAACGGEAGDLLALEVGGGFEQGETRLTVTEDGRGRCGDGALEPITGETLLEAREVVRDLQTLAEDGAAFDGQATRGRRRYVARTRDGTVRWVEGTPGLPEVLPRAALLAARLDDRLCPGGETG